MKKPVKALAMWTLAVCFLTGAVPAAQAATIRLNTPKIVLDLAPGETYTGEVAAENPTEDSLATRIYLEDWVYENPATGEKTFTPQGTTPMSASGWITFTPAEATMEPYGRLNVRYTIQVPPDAKGSYFSVMFIETILGSAVDDEGVNVLVAGRIGALFFIEVKGTGNREGKIESVTITPPQGNSPLYIETDFHNTGNVDIALEGNYLMIGADGAVVGRGELAKIYTFPGDKGISKTEWVGRLAKGDYELILTYNLGKGKTLVEERTFTVTE